MSTLQVSNITGQPTSNLGIVNATSIAVGANVIVNTSAIYVSGSLINSSAISIGNSNITLANNVIVGNTTVNSTVNSSSLYIANSTANVTIGQTITGGFIVNTYNIGTISSGTVTLSPLNGNYQYYINNGAHTLSSPVSDCAIDILITNGVSAGPITLSGFTANSFITGDPYTTTNTYKYILSMRRMNSVSTYLWKSLQ